jgi:hypothetical protein
LNSAFYRIGFVVCVMVVVAMLVLAGVFVGHVHTILRLNKEGLAFLSSLLGLILFLVGGGLLLRTLGHSIKRAMSRGRRLQTR